jgi:chromosome segregation ATPase
VQVEQAASLVAIGKQLESICQHTQRLADDTKYEKAYRSEQQKLQQSVAQFRKLESDYHTLAQADTYYRNELIPSYDNVLQLQTQTLKETEAENLELRAKSRAREEKHAQTQELLSTRDQKVDTLSAEIQVLKATLNHGPQSSLAMRKRLRSSNPAVDAPVRRVRKCRLVKPGQMKLGA